MTPLILQTAFLGMSLGTAPKSQVFETQHHYQSQREFKVLSFNVQNLFDTIDSPDTKDEKYTPSGDEAWTTQILNDKLKNLARVIQRSDADIIGLVEIENKEVVAMLRAQLGSTKFRYSVTGPSEDSRGIRNAVISKFPIKSAVSHRVSKLVTKTGGRRPFKTRDILEVGVEIPSPTKKIVQLLVNHWPARIGDTAWYRGAIADYMAELKDELLSEGNDLVISLGDFNDEYRDPSIQDNLSVAENYDRYLNHHQSDFFVANSEISNLDPKNRGTYYFKGGNEWREFDMIFVAQSYWSKKRYRKSFHFKKGSFRVLQHEYRYSGTDSPIGCSKHQRRHAGDQKTCKKGASDHWPIVATFQYK